MVRNDAASTADGRLFQLHALMVAEKLVNVGVLNDNGHFCERLSDKFYFLKTIFILSMIILLLFE